MKLAPRYASHPLADIFPPLEGDGLAELVSDIAVRGLREPITLYEGKVLDGRNRQTACEEIGVEPTYIEWQPLGENDTPLAFVISRNLHRRHLTDSQRAMIASRLANTPKGGGAHVRAATVNLATAATMLNVSTRAAQEARQVQRNAPAEVVAKVDSGQMKIGTAYRDLTRKRSDPPPQTAEVVALPPSSRERAENGHLLRVTDGGKSLPELITDLLEMLRSRPREVLQIAKPTRVELARDFAIALHLIADNRADQTLTGNGLA